MLNKLHDLLQDKLNIVECRRNTLVIEVRSGNYIRVLLAGDEAIITTIGDYYYRDNEVLNIIYNALESLNLTIQKPNVGRFIPRDLSYANRYRDCIVPDRALFTETDYKMYYLYYHLRNLKVGKISYKATTLKWASNKEIEYDVYNHRYNITWGSSKTVLYTPSEEIALKYLKAFIAMEDN